MMHISLDSGWRLRYIGGVSCPMCGDDGCRRGHCDGYTGGSEMRDQQFCCEECRRPFSANHPFEDCRICNQAVCVECQLMIDRFRVQRFICGGCLEAIQEVITT